MSHALDGRVPDRGTYALVLYMPVKKRIRVGQLGVYEFPKGWYLYLGSAMSGLTARIGRHLRREKKLFWHIDYLLEFADVYDVWTETSRVRLECAWARAALSLPNARVLVRGFGSSDCGCPAHLVHLAAEQQLRGSR